jgi:hypothetical protein
MLESMNRMHSRQVFILVIAVWLAPGLPADEVSAELEAGIGYTSEGTTWAGFYDLARINAGFSSDFLDLGFAFHVTNDGHYEPKSWWLQELGGQYFVLDEGFTRLHTGNLLFEGGYLKALSSIETPYEVFINPGGHSSLGMVLGYTGSVFEYESRWIGVNIRSSNTYGYGQHTDEPWRDKGVNYRLLSVRLGDWRVGYEESTVYMDRAFDPLYFLSPMPSILTNSVLTVGGAPWAQGGEVNDNSLMGLFAEYRSGPAYAEVQLLVDDLNPNFLLSEDSPLAFLKNLTKLAWSLGGQYRFGFGTLGFWHGGATAHTFAATYPTNLPDPPYDMNTLPYEYVYYPVVEYDDKMLDVRDSSIGFPWGENALAFRVTFDTEILESSPWGFGLRASLEYVMNGSKSPDNPWHEYTEMSSIPQRIQLFNVGGPEVLEHRITLHAKATKQLGDFEARIGIDIGGVFNGLEAWYGTPEMIARDEPPILKPEKGNNRFVFVVELGARYLLDRELP